MRQCRALGGPGWLFEAIEGYGRQYEALRRLVSDGTCRSQRETFRGREGLTI